jgi:hypothetical protein
MTENDNPWIKIPDDVCERLARLALETQAIAGEQCTRFARPEERQQVGLRIDPATARVFFVYAQTLDPYGDYPDLPEELYQVGREYFAVDPTEGIAVLVSDLPEATQAALDYKRRLAERDGWRRVFEIT